MTFRHVSHQGSRAGQPAEGEPCRKDLSERFLVESCDFCVPTPLTPLQLDDILDFLGVITG